MGRALLVLIALVGAWLAWSGPYSLKPLVAGCGVFACGLVFWLNRKMHWGTGQEPISLTVAMLLRMPRYLFFLAVQVASSSWRVALFTLHPRIDVSPRLIRVRASQRTELGRVIYANSITLTPGTITLDVDGDELLVYALGPVSAESVVSGTIDRAVTRLEGAP